MKKIYLSILLSWITSICFSNNLSVSNVSMTGQNTASDYTFVQFDISWDNSWRTSTLESNWDAAWIFIKWRLKTQTTWNHAILNTTGHTQPSGSTITASPDGKGVFIYRSSNGTGTNTWTDVELRWNYGTQGLLDGELVEVAVFAIEMVYVPQGAFYVGDGTTSNIAGQFEAGTTGTPFLISSESSITLGGGGSGSLGNNNASGMFSADDFNDASSQTLSSSYPKGYEDFYVMKYEITQEQYLQFLNKLTYTQQATRTNVAPNSSAGTNALTSGGRNGIDIKTPGTSSTIPAEYACNFNGNATYDESNDGQNISCSSISWSDLAAYLDWSGLRPITELEFEKATRGGNLAAVANEFSWGTTNMSQATGITNSGSANEVATSGYCVNNNISGVSGPMRVGNFAQTGTSRQNSGASYYGSLELSGNLDEGLISLGNSAGRAFSGVHGDGNLDATGNADVTNWPGTNAIGACRRGGNWYDGPDRCRISDRYTAAHTNTSDSWGGRGARNAP